MKQTWIVAGALLACGMFFSGCETSEDNAIAKAQACLDTADKSTAADCRKGIDGIDNANAWLIRCSTDFISQGFDTATMTQAFTQLSNASGNTTTAMMGFLVFSTNGTVDNNAAAQAIADCTKSQVPSMALLGAFAQTATLIASMCSNGSCDPSRDTGFPSAGFTDGIAQLYTPTQPAPGTDAAAKEAIIGNAVLVAYNQQCSNSANSSTPICAEVVAAMKGSKDPATIGYNLIVALHDNP